MTALARALGTTQRRARRAGHRARRRAAAAVATWAPTARRSSAAVKAIIARPELQLTPDVPGAREIRELIEAAW